MLTLEQIAEVCHSANKGYCDAIGDRTQVNWADADEWQRNSAVAGVKHAIQGATPKELHAAWCTDKIRDGWVHGCTKSAEHKTHPCLVSYECLPPEQRLKDALFSAVVMALTD